MTEKSKNLIKEEILNLSKEIQEAINDSNWEKLSEEIGKKYLINEDEVNTFQLETISFLLGLIDEESYQKNIEDDIGTSKDEAEKMAEEVMQKIFNPISEKILEKIKTGDRVKKATPEQNLNFILSGGDYTAFLEQKENTNNKETSETVLPVFFIKK